MDELNRRKLKVDQRLLDNLMDLKYKVDNINQTPGMLNANGIYTPIDKGTVLITRYDGWEIGYRLEDRDPMLRKKVYIKCEQKLNEVPDLEKESILTAAMEVFLDRGQKIPDIETITEFTIMIQQDVLPLILVERAPRLVSKGRPRH